MSLLRTRKRVEVQAKFMLYLEQDMIKYINLFALANNTTRTTIVRELLEDWREKNQETMSEEALMDKIMYTVERQWASMRKDRVNNTAKYKTFDDFLDQVEEELINRNPKIDLLVAKTIIRRLDEKNKSGKYST